MKYLSVCSGIEAATVAWHSLSWQPAAFSEIDAFPRAVLQYHYPSVPLHGDFTTIQAGDYGAVDLLAGGTPCQSFSVAGLRGGLADDRGNLALEFARLAWRIKPRWIVWENVPGVLSSNGGRDFGAILGALVELGYGWAYRVLDAQYFGVPQRRRRVFVVGHLGSWQRAAAVLFERESLRGNPAPRRKAGQDIAQCITTGVGKRYDPETDTLIPCYGIPGNWIGRKPENGGNAVEPMLNIAPCQTKTDRHAVAVIEDPVPPLMARSSRGGAQTLSPGHQTDGHMVAIRNQVRRLTPTECERLQGFPDGYTAIPWRGKSAENCPDGPRYKALGNSMAVPVMRWIGQRIQMVEVAA